jgi:hypothetical protein
MQTAKKLAEKTFVATEGTLALGMLWVALGAAKFSALCAKAGVKLMTDMAERAATSDFVSGEQRKDIARIYAEMNEALAQIK